MLLTMATGTGKTAVAFQICWKLWSARWNRTGEYRRPRILYLADRNILVDQPKDGIFAVFGDARHKIESGQVAPRRSGRSARPRPRSENNGLTPQSAPRSSRGSQNGVSVSTNWRMLPNSLTQIPSTCCAIWPSMPRYEPAARGRSSSRPIRRASSLAIPPRRAPY